MLKAAQEALGGRADSLVQEKDFSTNLQSPAAGLPVPYIGARQAPLRAQRGDLSKRGHPAAFGSQSRTDIISGLEKDLLSDARPLQAPEGQMMKAQPQLMRRNTVKEAPSFSPSRNSLLILKGS